MKNKSVMVLLLGCMIMIIVSMFIAVSLILKTQKELKKYVYAIDNTNLESNIAIMIYDEEVNDYVKADTMPKGKYELNDEKTGCAAGGTVSDYNPENGTIKYSLNTSDECYLYFDIDNSICEKNIKLSDCIKKIYTNHGTAMGDGVLYLHDSTLENGAKDNSYRYAGTNPDNYACFKGSDCSNADNLYRIIGIFGENIKVIKMTSVGDMPRDVTGNNYWMDSSIESFLNNEWLVNMEYSELIEPYYWEIGEYSSYLIPVPQKMLVAELSKKTTIKRKVGLMYASDYGYAAEKIHWDTNLYSYEKARESNWMYINSEEWTVSRVLGYATAVYIVSYGNGNAGSIDGMVSYNGDVTSNKAVRPTFYLVSKIKYVKGAGTQASPIILE